MRNLTSIVAVNEQGAIGCQNALPWNVKSDLKFFRETTVGNIVILGRKTHDSIGKCLPKRLNIILSHNPLSPESSPNCKLARSVDEALFAAEYAITQNSKRQAFVVGGAQTYSQFAPYVDRYIITIVDKKIKNADAFLDPKIVADLENWKRREIQPSAEIRVGDDASFSIWEFLHPFPDEVRSRRLKLVRDAAQRNHFWKPVHKLWDKLEPISILDTQATFY